MSTNAPYRSRRVTLPVTVWPRLISLQSTAGGSIIVRPMRFSLRLADVTHTVTSSPSLTTSDGLATRVFAIWLTGTRPSLDAPMLTNAPNSSTRTTLPVSFMRFCKSPQSSAGVDERARQLDPGDFAFELHFRLDILQGEDPILRHGSLAKSM